MPKHLLTALMVLCLFFGAVSVCGALDVEPKQILIESKIVYISRTERDAIGEFAFVITPLGDTQTKVEATALAYGRGADFRKWLMESPVILTPSKERILPTDTQKIYVPKSSIAAPVAPFLFAAIGSQYEPYADKAASSPGTPCSTGGGHGASDDRGSTAKAIDKAGMAAGMGLLASQAKGELQGIRTTFIIPESSTVLLGGLSLKDDTAPNKGVPVLKDIPLVGYLFRAEARHKDKQNLIVFITPMIVSETGE